jgi:Ni/Fe-hydrogenase subunit HybB-like protein
VKELTVALTHRLRSLTPGYLAWLALLSVSIITGITAAYQVVIKGLSITNLTDSVPWGLWITIDLSAIALGAGAFTMSAVVYLFRLHSFKPIVRLAVLIGIIGYTSAMLTLVLDIGRPDRFWHPWVYWNVHSVLWEITWAISLYLLVMLTEFAPVIAELPVFRRVPLIRRVGHSLHRAAPMLALIGMLISLIHQSSLGATYGILKSRPVWFKPSMPILFVLSAIAVGPAVTMGLAIVVRWATGRRTVPVKALRTIARFSGFTLMAYAYFKFWDLAVISYYGRTPGTEKAFSLLYQTSPYGFGFWVGEVAVGIVLPVALFLIPRFNRNPPSLVLGAFAAGIGILVHRWNVTVSGLTVPPDFSPGVLYQPAVAAYWPSLAEWGVALGILGYALLALTLAIRYLPLFPPHETIRMTS